MEMYNINAYDFALVRLYQINEIFNIFTVYLGEEFVDRIL